jgi:hypothetical protein
VLKYFPLQKPFLVRIFTKSGISLEGRVDLMTWRFESAKKHTGLVKLGFIFENMGGYAVT